MRALMTHLKPLAVTALITAVVGGTLAVTLSAASAGSHPGTASVWVDQTLGFFAGNGTVNTIEVKPLASGGFTFTDSGETLELTDDAGSGCTLTTSHTSSCTAAVTGVSAMLNDGNDKFTSTAAVTSHVDAGAGDDLLLGGTGEDYLSGDGGSDLVYGGFGRDYLRGGAGVDTLFGQAGDDNITSEDNLDALWGSSGNDWLIGGKTMHGDDNDDVLFAERGAEVWGGTETDRVSFGNWTEPVRVSLDDRANDGNASADPTSTCGTWPNVCPPGAMNVHSDVENVTGTDYSDRIIGSNTANALDGGWGNDVLDGRGGNDYLDVEKGAEQTVHGGSGANDTCVGYGITIRDGCEH
jgi:Ca2+-binding RTX toxin-like protein